MFLTLYRTGIYGKLFFILLLLSFTIITIYLHEITSIEIFLRIKLPTRWAKFLLVIFFPFSFHDVYSNTNDPLLFNGWNNLKLCCFSWNFWKLLDFNRLLIGSLSLVWNRWFLWLSTPYCYHFVGAYNLIFFLLLLLPFIMS